MSCLPFMVSLWCKLEKQVDILSQHMVDKKVLFHMDAPVPTLKSEHVYRQVQHNAQLDDEGEFTKRYGETISENYKETIDAMLTAIEDKLKVETKALDFWSEVINICVGRNRSGIVISFVLTRPCALRCGFYKMHFVH